MHAEKSKRLNKNCNPLKPTTSVPCYFNVLSKNILSSFRHSFFIRISLTLFVCMTKVNAIRMKKSAWQNSQKRRCILVHLFVLNAENTVDELKYRNRERTYLAGSTAGGTLASARVSGGAVVRTHLAVGTRRIADSWTTHNSHIAAQFSASVHLAAAT